MCVCVCVCVCVFVCVSDCVCVCVRERERECVCGSVLDSRRVDPARWGASVEEHLQHALVHLQCLGVRASESMSLKCEPASEPRNMCLADVWLC